MRTKIVVGRVQNDRAVHFQQSLSVLIAFFDVAIFHSANALLGDPERIGERCIEHQPGSTISPRTIRRGRVAGGLALRNRLDVSRASLTGCSPSSPSLAAQEPNRIRNRPESV